MRSRSKWDRVEGATGYRVLRSNSAGGPFAVVADFDATPGQTLRFEGGITVWTPIGYPWIEYIEYGEARTRWFQVIAYNANGDAPPSVTVSGSSREARRSCRSPGPTALWTTTTPMHREGMGIDFTRRSR